APGRLRQTVGGAERWAAGSAGQLRDKVELFVSDLAALMAEGAEWAAANAIAMA
ncbi:unnamed protein product, partial [Prorocentrum cordatum]